MTYIKRSIYTIISLIVCLLLLTTLYYFNLINTNIYKYLKFVIIIINIFISSYILGKSATSKGYLEGIKNASIYIILFIIISLLINSSFSPKSLLYYFIILFTSTVASMFGISKKKKSYFNFSF